MTLHHSKHHAAYIKNLNAALSKLSTETIPSSRLVEHVSMLQAIKFNAGGHINHTLFWQNLTPPSKSDPSKAPRLIAALSHRWGSLDAFKRAFEAQLLGIQGSGWGWLVAPADAQGGDHLDIVQTHDQDPVAVSQKPILGVDMWEHAYYLQYQNNKAQYAARIWEVVDWEVLEERYLGTTQTVYGEELLGLMGDGGGEGKL